MRGPLEICRSPGGLGLVRWINFAWARRPAKGGGQPPRLHGDDLGLPAVYEADGVAEVDVLLQVDEDLLVVPDIQVVMDI